MIESPMPRALSLIRMEQSIAIDTNIVVISIPVMMTVIPVEKGTNNNTGIPMPTKKDTLSAMARP